MSSIMRLDSDAWSAKSESSISNANNRLANSVARLSSGERLVRAGDDVASLSIAATMATRLASLKMAQLNMAQASSLLQVMDGGLSKIQDVLLRMQALSVQASSGTLTEAERRFLDQEFQQLYKEISRIANNTQFSGVTPLNTDSQVSPIYHNAVALDDRHGERYSAFLSFEGNWTAANRTINLGTFDTAPDNRFYWRTNTATGNPAFNFQHNTRLLPKLESMVSRWNDPNGPIQQDERFSGVTMELIGNGIQITSRSRGEQSQLFAISDLSAHANVQAVMNVAFGEDFQRNAASTIFNYVLKADGTGSATGLQMGSTIGVGETTSPLIADFGQNPGEIRLRMTGNFTNNQQLRIDDGQNGLLNFVFRTPATATNPFLHIPMGTNTIDTLDNTVAFLNNFVSYNQNNAGYSTWYSMAHLEFSREGNDLVIRNKLPGNPVDLFGNTYNFRDTLTNGTINNGVASGANLDMISGSDSGVNTAGVINKDFTGTIQGFEAVYMGYNKTNISVKVGDATYLARITDTNPATTNRVRFFSDDHGYFDVDLQAGKGMVVSNQAQAEHYAKQFDDAFAGLTFYQQRVMTSFEPRPPSPLVGAKIEMQQERYDQPLIIEDFSVKASQQNNGNARISMTINGETYLSTQRIDRGIRPTASVTLHSMNDANRTITFTNNNTATFNLTTADDAAQFEAYMRAELPFGSIEQVGEGALSFQADKSHTNVILVQTFDATAESLFDGAALDITTVTSAQNAADITRNVIDKVISMRASVGASQQQSQMVMDTIATNLLNEGDARSQLADVDIAAESTLVALDYVRLNAGIAALSQIGGLRNEMIKQVVESAASQGETLGS